MLVQALVCTLLFTSPVPSQHNAKDAKPNLDADLLALAKALDSAPKDGVGDLVVAFADKHRPTKTPIAYLVSKDKTIAVEIAANASEKNPVAIALEFKPTATKYNIAVGGNGLDSKTDVGGNGGDVMLKAKAQGKAILIAGAGGKGADGKPKEAGKTGGNGGNVWFGENLKDGDVAIGGRAGDGGNGGKDGGAGGTGGRGGTTGAAPPK